MASDPQLPAWSDKLLHGGHVALRFPRKGVVQASIEGERLDIAGTLVPVVARAETVELALQALWDRVRGQRLVKDSLGPPL